MIFIYLDKTKADWACTPGQQKEYKKFQIILNNIPF
jgi:hypothetical protein